MKKIEFNDLTIHDLFGFEDAESQDIGRLKEFFIKKDTYKRVAADVPVRLLVGNKGTGKSALFHVAMSEEKEKGNIPILIKPDDIAELGKNDENFLLRIRQWKYGLTKIIGEKALEEFGFNSGNYLSTLTKFGLKIVNFLNETIRTDMVSLNLNESQQLLIDNFIRNNQIVIYIDDLDRGWEGKKEDISRISALLNCVRDMASENKGLRFKIALRTDVYYSVRTSDESTDKIEGTIVWYQWTHHQILVLLIKRILTYLGKTFDEEIALQTPQMYLAYHLDHIFEEKFQGKGKWSNKPMYKVLMSLTRNRPRDLVKLCSMAANEAYYCGSNLITTEHIESVLEKYSIGRIQDTINEYKTELPQIERLLFGMRPSRKERITMDSYVYNTVQLKQKIRNIIQQGEFRFTNQKKPTEQDLILFLFRINFITARKIDEEGEIDRKYFEENRFISSSFVDFGYDWEIHPVFRWALQPDDLKSIMSKLLPSSDK